ncbi:MAG: FAD-dependent monooxygenase [Actinobacteria bacterium]|nr:FAD-dependent monooxygenase [Actinomycetota bacterium]
MAYRLGDTDHELRCRLVVGADGRRPAVRRQLGVTLHETDPVTIGGGMLVDEVPAWPQDLDATDTEGDLYFLAFPRPGGRVRVYLLWSMADKGRFTGPERQREFLDDCRVRSLPYGEAVAGGRPGGPCSSYLMNDSWCERTVADGVVLVGDAAGRNDPIIGQGVSIAARDARMVSEVLLAADDWSPSAFLGYVEERAERLRRLRFVARIVTVLRATFSPEGAALRRRWGERAQEDPRLLAPLLASLVGPEQVNDDAFTDASMQRILSPA